MVGSKAEFSSRRTPSSNTFSFDSQSTRSLVWQVRKAAKSNRNFLWKLVSPSPALIYPHHTRPSRLSGRIGIIFGSAAPLPQSSTHTLQSYSAAKNQQVNAQNLVSLLYPVRPCKFRVAESGRPWSGGDVIARKELKNGEK